MARVFGATSTAEQVLDGIDLKGRRVLITGASAGIGSETARALAAHGADVIGTARDMAKARQVSGAITAAAQAGGGAFALAPLDLASLRSVRECADNLLADGRTFDLLIANAGLMATTLSRTEDGFETDFGTNHLGHFALINWLLSRKPGDLPEFIRPSVCRHRSGRPQFRTDAVRPQGRLRPVEDGERPVRRRIRSQVQRPGHSCGSGPSGPNCDGAEPLHEPRHAPALSCRQRPQSREKPGNEIG